jgi:hypothetical protein
MWPFRGYPSIGCKELCRRSNEENIPLTSHTSSVQDPIQRAMPEVQQGEIESH